MNRIRSIRLSTQLSQQKFGDKYHIPLRTIQNWELGISEAPIYVVELLERVVNEDRLEELNKERAKHSQVLTL